MYAAHCTFNIKVQCTCARCFVVILFSGSLSDAAESILIFEFTGPIHLGESSFSEADCSPSGRKEVSEELTEPSGVSSRD